MSAFTVPANCFLSFFPFSLLPTPSLVFSHRKYAEALDYHRQALVLIPQNASTYSAIGYIHSLMGNFENAVDYFHTVCLVNIYHLFIYLFIF